MTGRRNRQKDTESEKLTRSMSLLSVTALGVGAMIGAGIFVLICIAAGEAGPALILAFALNGIIALIVGACYAELSFTRGSILANGNYWGS